MKIFIVETLKRILKSKKVIAAAMVLGSVLLGLTLSPETAEALMTVISAVFEAE